MIAISMRVMEIRHPSGMTEKRDALDQDWHKFIAQALPEEMLLPVPNIGQQAQALLERLPGLTGLVLSGGEDWGQTPERDAAETALFQFFRSRELPILGVCRGAQVINRILGGSLQAAGRQPHKATRHTVELLASPAAPPGRMEVNSFHSSIIRAEDLAAGLTPFALAEDDSVEGFFAPGLAATMWHPEREKPASDFDRQLLRVLFIEKKLFL